MYGCMTNMNIICISLLMLYDGIQMGEHFTYNLKHNTIQRNKFILNVMRMSKWWQSFGWTPLNLFKNWAYKGKLFINVSTGHLWEPTSLMYCPWSPWMPFRWKPNPAAFFSSRHSLGLWSTSAGAGMASASCSG